MVTALLYIVGLPLIVLSVEVSEWFLILVLVLIFACGSLNFSLRCPKCGWRIQNNPVKFLGVQMYGWGGKLGKNCIRCGEPQ